MIYIYLAPLVILLIVLGFISLARGKDYKLVIKLPPTDTTQGQVIRALVVMLGLGLIVLATLNFSSDSGSDSLASKIVTGAVLLLVIVLAGMASGRFKKDR
jgi:hypothetical protein